MAKITGKEAGYALLMGSLVIVITALLSSFWGNWGFMSTVIIPNILTVGTALGAGVGAFVADMIVVSIRK